MRKIFKIGFSQIAISILLLAIFSQPFSIKAQNRISFFEDFLFAGEDYVDSILSKSNFKIQCSNYTRQISDTTLYGVETIWSNMKDEYLKINKMQVYIPLYKDSSSHFIELGRNKSIGYIITYSTSSDKKANEILKSLKTYQKRRVSPIGSGIKTDYESEENKLTVEKRFLKEDKVMIFNFILESKSYMPGKSEMFAD
jgi:hypothetical protein